MENRIKKKNERSRSLALTAAVHAVNHSVFNMFPPLGLSLSHYFHFENISHVTLGFSLYLMLYGFGQVPIGFMSDRLPRKALLAGGTLLNAAAVATAAVFPSYEVFLVSMVVAGLGAAAYHPAGAAYLSDLYSESKGKALGISGMGATVGLVVGPALGGVLCDAAGWRVTFIVFSAISAAVGILFYAAAIEPGRERVADRQQGDGWGLPIIMFLAAAAAVFTFREFAGWGGYYLIPIFAETVYKYAPSASGMLSGFQSLGGFIAQPLGGWLSDRFGRRALMSVLLFFAAAFVVSIPFAGRQPFGLVVFLYGMAYTATVPIIDALIADRTPSRIRGSVFGIFMAAGIGIGAFSPLIQGRIIDTGGAQFHAFKVCFVMLGVSLLVSMAILLFFRGAEKGISAEGPAR